MTKNTQEQPADAHTPVLWRILGWPQKAIRRLYAWMMKWGDSPWAERALFGFSFSESSFFPIPPDPLLIAMVISNAKKWFRFALITTVASVLGAILGYIIGLLFFESIGQAIIEAYHLHAEFETVGRQYGDNAFWAIFAAGFTPIPFKVFTLAGGLFQVNLVSLVVASVLSRGLRFTLVAFLAHKLGARYKDKIEKYIDILSIGFLVAIVLGFLAIRYVM